MSEMNYWSGLRRRRISRRTMLSASAKAGVGAAGLALVGCGDDDDDDSATAVVEDQAEEQAEQAQVQAEEEQAQVQAEQAVEEEEAEEEAEEQAQAVEEEEEAEEAEEEEVQAVSAFADIDLDATIVTTTPADAGGLDQVRAGSHTNYISHQCVYDCGIKLGPDTNEVLSHLIAPEWVDGVTLVSTITPAPFHDGTTFTAADAVFTHNRAGNIAEYHNGGETTDNPAGWTSARTTYGAQDWARNEAVDDATWLIELPEPDAGYVVVAHTGAVQMISQAYTERVGDAEMDRAPMGTGPYRFVSHEDDTDFIFERFDEHFNPLDHPVNVPHVPFHKRLEVLVRPEVLSRLAGLEAGEIDTVPGLGFSDVKPFLDDEDFNVFLQPAGAASVHNVYPNLNNPELEDGSPNPFLDVRVRIAANMALNRQAIIDNLLSGTEEQALFTFSGAIGYPTPEQKKEVTFPYDVEGAKALMAEAGYPDGFETTLHIPAAWGQLVDEYSLIVKQDLEAIGIRLTIREWAAAEFFTDAAVRARPGFPGLWWFFGNTNPDVGSMGSCCIHPDGPYAVAPGSPRVLELFAQQKVELDADKRKELITELFLQHAREATFIFVVEPKEGVITGANIRWPAGEVIRRSENLNFATQKVV